ncbi:MAG: TolC family protein [Gemmatimonadota bacterium]|nr:MAG: TolC family protein [Gemmatimonadota bacterium]
MKRRDLQTSASCRALVAIGLLLVVPVAAIGQEYQPGPLTLPDAIALALETHPTVGVAVASEAAAAAAVGETNAAWWPRLSTQFSLIENQEPMLVAPLHGFGPEQLERIEFEETLIQGNLSLGWTVFDGGARVNRIRGARAGAAVAEASRTAAEMGLTAAVTRTFLQVLTADGVLDAQERRILALSAERQRVAQFLEQGQAARVELLRVDAALAEAEAQRIATVADLDLAERDLARLIDLPVSETRVGELIPVRLSGASRLSERAQLIETAGAMSPELQQARRDLERAEAGRRVARASWLPSLNLNGSYLGFSSAAGNTATEWNVGLALSYPIFTGGARSSAVGRASAELRRAQEQLRLAELQTTEAVDQALSAARETNALVEALGRAVEHQTEVVRIEQLSLEAGAGTQTDYLRAEADLARARSLLVQARHAEIAARVELARVTGELTVEWLYRNLENAQ